jgi:hypothetical protein
MLDTQTHDENGMPNKTVSDVTTESSPKRDSVTPALEGVSRVHSPQRSASRLPGGKLINLTVTMTIESLKPAEIINNPKMQKLICDSVSKATHVPLELIRIKDVRGHVEVKKTQDSAASAEREASDVDVLITAPTSLFPEEVDPLDRVLQLLTTDPFLAQTGPTVTENGFAAAVRRCKSEAMRGLGLRQSSGLRNKSAERSRPRSRSGSNIRPTIHIEHMQQRSFPPPPPPDSFDEPESFMGTPASKNSAMDDQESLDDFDQGGQGLTDEKKKLQRDNFRERIAAASKDTALKMKKIEWQVGSKRSVSASAVSTANVSKLL